MNMSLLSALNLFLRPSRPRIYIVGKIRKNDFRHDLVRKLRGWEQEDGPIDCGSSYVGPFFRSCDHGCSHVEGAHGFAGTGCDAVEISRRTVKNRNQTALASADLVFAFIDEPEAYGSLWELGWAACAGIPTYLFFGPGVDPDDFWYASRESLNPQQNLSLPSDLLANLRAAASHWWRRK